MKKSEHAIAQILLTSQAVTLNVDDPYTYSSGIRSPIYCDNRLLISNPNTRKQVVEAFCEKIVDLKPKQIAGVATAGISWGSWISEKLNLPFIYVRSKPKGHGKEKQIEGDFIRESTVLIEDLVSTGKSSIEAWDGLQKENVPVSALVAIFTYGLAAAKDAFTKNKIEVRTLTTLDTLLEEAIEHKKLKSDQKSEVLRWRANPEFWFETRSNLK